MTPPRRLLIVDDEEDIRIVAQLAIALTTGWEARIAESGYDALDVCRDWRPEALLLDVMMPGLDGVETLHKLRGDPLTAEIPVVFLTAKSAVDAGPPLESHDVLGVIRKPFDPLGLGGEVARMLHWPMGD